MSWWERFYSKTYHYLRPTFNLSVIDQQADQLTNLIFPSQQDKLSELFIKIYARELSTRHIRK